MKIPLRPMFKRSQICCRFLRVKPTQANLMQLTDLRQIFVSIPLLEKGIKSYKPNKKSFYATEPIIVHNETNATH